MFKLFSKIFISFMFFHVCMFSFLPCFCMEDQPPEYERDRYCVRRMGVVNIEKILERLPITQNIKDQIEAIRQVFAEEVGVHEASLRAEDKKLTEDQKILSGADFSLKREAFEKSIENVQEIVKKRKAQLDSAFSDAMEKVNGAVMTAISAVAQTKELDIVLFPMSVAYSRDDFDISEEVSKIVRHTLREVKVEMPPLDFSPQ